MSVIFDETNKTAKLEYGAEEINTKLGQINDLETKKHTHSNQTVIDKLSEVDGQLKYDGNAISGGTSLTEEQITNIGKVSTIETNVSNLETTVGNKVDKVEGKTLTSNDFTNDYKTKLDGLQNYTLPTATTDVLGGVKVDGTSMTVDSDGTIHSTANISDETFNTKINEYLTANPPSAMTDEQVANSVNKGIADDSIDVVAGIKDDSIVLDKLNYENVFGAIKYEVYKSGAWCTFTVNLNGTTGLTSNLEFSFISDTILNTLVQLVVVYDNAGFTNDTVGLSHVDNGDGTYTYTGTLATLKSNVSKVQLQYRGTTGSQILSGIFSNISVVIDGVNIESTVLIEDGVTTNKEENPLIATKSNLNNSTLALNNKIDDGLLYARNKVYENQLKNLKLAYSINSKSGFSNSNCTDIEGGGVKITGGGVLYDNREITTDTFSMEMFFDIIDTTTSTRLGFFTRSGAIFMVNVTDNTLEILEADINYGTDNGNIIVSKTIPWTLTNSEKYKLALVKDKLTYTLILTNLATDESISIYTTLCYMFGTGRVGIKTYGTTAINVYRYNYYLSNYKYSNVLIMGDSITQGVGLTDINNRWCGKLLKEYYEGDGVIWGKGFDTSSDTLTRLTKMFKFGYKFNKVIIMIGTNNTGNDETYTTWESNIVDIYNLIIENGAEPIICVPPSKRANMSNVLKMRDFILSKGWNTIRMDIATSVDQLGQAIDESITTDGTHFNDKGNLRMYERAVKDLNNGILLEDEKENADNIKFDNSVSGLTATDVYSAINELKTMIDSLKTS